MKNTKLIILTKYGVLCKQRSDQANTLGEINSKNRGVFNRKKEVA
jgi:hypothetical protein